MKVRCLTADEALLEMIANTVLAGLTCHRSVGDANQKEHFDGMGFIKKLIGYGHESVLEHINITFYCEDFSRALLQEIARHRHISLSVESTRHAMHKRVGNSDGKLRDNLSEILTLADIPLISEYVSDDDSKDDGVIANEIAEPLAECIDLMNHLQKYIKQMQSKGIKTEIINDFCKYFLPECFPTTFVMTLNLRELRHIFKLRTAPAALLEFRTLCIVLYDSLPDFLKELTSDCIDKDQLEVYHAAQKRAGVCECTD